MFAVTQSDLQKPLLGTEPDDNRMERQQQQQQYFTKNDDNDDDDTVDSDDCSYDSDDDEEIASGCTLTCTVNSTDDDDEDNSQESIRRCLVDHWIILLVLPTLLVIQFGLAFSAIKEEQDNNNKTTGVMIQNQFIHIDWTTVNYTIVLFMIASYLFRRAITTSNCTWILIHLLPEIFMDIILGLVLFRYIVTAFLVMVSATCLMALYSAFSSCRLFIQYEIIDEPIVTPVATGKKSVDNIKKAIDNDYYMAVV
jgi:hypothetical protein